jgi:hypothetical protein
MYIMLYRKPGHTEHNIRMDHSEMVGKAWIEFVWLRIGLTGGIL